MHTSPLIDRHDLDRADSYDPDPVDLDLTLLKHPMAEVMPQRRRWLPVVMGLVVVIGLALLGTVHLWAPHVDRLGY